MADSINIFFLFISKWIIQGAIWSKHHHTMCMRRDDSSDGANLCHNSTLYNDFHFDWTNDAYFIHSMWRQKRIYPNGSLNRSQRSWGIIPCNLQGYCHFTRSHQSVEKSEILKFENCVDSAVGNGQEWAVIHIQIVYILFSIIPVRKMPWSLRNRPFKCGYRLSPNASTSRQLNWRYIMVIFMLQIRDSVRRWHEFRDIGHRNTSHSGHL